MYIGVNCELGITEGFGLGAAVHAAMPSEGSTEFWASPRLEVNVNLM